MKNKSSLSVSSAPLSSGITDFIEILEAKAGMLDQATKVRDKG